MKTIKMLNEEIREFNTVLDVCGKRDLESRFRQVCLLLGFPESGIDYFLR